MADIFLSYAREDAETARKLAQALEAAGYSCWWDQNLATGERYLDATERELAGAKAVIVLWSKESVKSHWVADEAMSGRDRGVLAPISIDGSMPPLGFRQFQVTDFAHWKGGAQEGPFVALVAALARLCAPSGEARPAPMPLLSSTDKHQPWPPRLPVIPAALAGLALLAAAIWGGMALLRPAPGPASPANQRVAFFGFTAADDNPLSARIAAEATDETFAELSRIRAPTAARAETMTMQTSDRLARASELGAGFALSGEVRMEGDIARIVIRVEDPAERATLTEIPILSPVNRPPYAPRIQAAAKAGEMIGCMLERRSLVPDGPPTIAQKLMAACTAVLSEKDVAAYRSAAEANPRSAPLQANLAAILVTSLDAYGRQAPAAREARWNEAGAALARARAIDPEAAFTVFAEALHELWRPEFSAERIKPVSADRTGRVKAVIARARVSEPGWAYLNNVHGWLLLEAGRSQEALAAFDQVDAEVPSFALARFFRAVATAHSGRGEAADRLHRGNFQRDPDFFWRAWIYNWFRTGAGDPELVLSAAPASVDAEELACWTQAVEAKMRPGQGQAPACVGQWLLGFVIHASFGDADEAFRLFDEVMRISPAGMSTYLFAPSTRPMRADARFLPLMRELGIWDYWLTTGTQPDVCLTEEERGFPVCVALREELAARANDPGGKDAAASDRTGARHEQIEER